ncbi:unnamed protein product [Dovyalis caffra]|uniref:Nucleoside-diphosphate kinase n=1 Tax=Dovyalis caffra TaxID=77055 RepID=A0AAV1QT12_9ROSI|nr:unnamed protein product [Dovyalis caffra]
MQCLHLVLNITVSFTSKIETQSHIVVEWGDTRDISSSPVMCRSLWHMIWNCQLVACLMIEAFPVEALNSIQHLNGSVDEMKAYSGINSIPYHIVSNSIHSGD